MNENASWYKIGVAAINVALSARLAWMVTDMELWKKAHPHSEGVNLGANFLVFAIVVVLTYYSTWKDLGEKRISRFAWMFVLTTVVPAVAGCLLRLVWK